MLVIKGGTMEKEKTKEMKKSTSEEQRKLKEKQQKIFSFTERVEKVVTSIIGE